MDFVFSRPVVYFIMISWIGYYVFEKIKLGQKNNVRFPVQGQEIEKVFDQKEQQNGFEHILVEQDQKMKPFWERYEKYWQHCQNVRDKIKTQMIESREERAKEGDSVKKDSIMKKFHEVVDQCKVEWNKDKLELNSFRKKVLEQPCSSERTELATKIYILSLEELSLN